MKGPLLSRSLLPGRQLLTTSVVPIGIALVSAILAGLCAVVAPAFFGQFWWAVFVLAGCLIILPWFVKNPESWTFAVLVLSLPFSARLRFGSVDLHPGGAEAALAPLDFPLAALLVLYLLQALRTGKLPFYNGTVECWLLLFGLVGGLSILNAADPSFVVYEFIRILKVIMLIYCTRRFVRGGREVNLVLYLLVFNVVTQSALGLMQLVLGRSLGLFVLGEADALWLDTSVEGTISRVGGTLGHANALAFFLEMLLPVALSLTIAKRIATSKRILFLLTFALGTTALILTFSRAGWVSLLVAMILILVFHLRHLKLSVRQVFTIGAVGIVLLVAAIALSGSIYHRLVASSSGSFTFRENLISIALNMIRAHPWLGIGLNNFTIVMAKYDPIGLTTRRLSPVHNIYFLTAAETGILGLIAFSCLLIGVFFEGWQALKAKDPFLSSGAAGILAGLVAVLVHSNLGWLWRYDVVYIAFWFLVGFVLSIKRLSNRATLIAKDGQGSVP